MTRLAEVYVHLQQEKRRDEIFAAFQAICRDSSIESFGPDSSLEVVLQDGSTILRAIVRGTIAYATTVSVGLTVLGGIRSGIDYLVSDAVRFGTPIIQSLQ